MWQNKTEKPDSPCLPPICPHYSTTGTRNLNFVYPFYLQKSEILYIYIYCDEFNCLEKLYKIYHILHIRKPKIVFSLYIVISIFLDVYRPGQLLGEKLSRI